MAITVRGLDRLMAKLERIRRDLQPEMVKATDAAVKYVHSQVPPYPATRPGQTYRRTGTLGRSITTEVRTIGREVVGVIGTPTVYAPWVISDEPVGSRGPQAWMHKGRWWTLQGVVRKAKNKAIDIYRQTLRRLIQS